MQAETRQLKKVLSGDIRYVIPTFQRDYEWTESGQWQLLFEDLDSVADRLSDARRHAELTGVPVVELEARVAPHFLGAIVCDRLPSPTGGLDVRAVIDGQQRLTTLQLLIRGVLDVLIENGSPRVTSVRRLLLNASDVVESPVEKYKLWPRRRDRLIWPTVMADEIPAESNHLYLKARKFFASKVRESSTDQSGRDRLIDLVDALTDLFKLVVIDLEANDDAQVIFEVLNGRQTPLSASDLVKNLLFLRGELADEDELEALYEKYWAGFDDPWWKQEVGTGHAARGRRDVLLSVWLTAVSGAEANVSHLYGAARQYLATSKRGTRDILAELHSYGNAYRAIYGADDAGSLDIATSYRRIDRLKILTAIPLLAWLRVLPDGELAKTDHERSVRAVESWLVRRMLLGGNTRGYNSAFLIVLQAAQAARRTGTSSIVDAIVESLGSSPNAMAWPSRSELEAAFRENRFYGRFTQERIRMVLGAIDERMQRENAKTEPARFDYENLQIEHVMPQAWQAQWPIVLAPDSFQLESAVLERNRSVDRIGNLTLVTSTFNQSVSNGAWASKRPELQQQSKLQLNGPVGTAEQWDEQAITERSLELARWTCEIWQGPEEI